VQAESASVKPMKTIRQNKIERLKRECLRDIGQISRRREALRSAA
jgi:hypothetical protein